MGTWVYSFGAGKADGAAKMRDLLGGKGANLAEMCSLGLPVPPGFTITTEVCRHYYEHDRRYPEGLSEQVRTALAKVEATAAARLGDPDRPLLVSVRSGAKVSMPGMMDTVLNLGLNDRTVEGLARSTDDARFAYDSYRRFIQMYGDVVLGVDHYLFEDRLAEIKREHGCDLDTELGADDLRGLVRGVSGDRRGAARRRLPAGRRGAVVGRDRRRLRLVDDAARGHLPPPARASTTSRVPR